MIQVIMSCNKEWIDEQLVEFIDICEDIDGADILTFKCPICNEHHTSKRFGRMYS
jgi:hypothetical protein